MPGAARFQGYAEPYSAKRAYKLETQAGGFHFDGGKNSAAVEKTAKVPNGTDASA